MVKKEIGEYLKEVRKIFIRGDYTEMTFRTAFETLIESLNKEYELIHEPKRVADMGAPDYKAFLGSANIGYIETKDLGHNLDNELESKQMKKYMESIDNIILTDYARFILIRKGQKVIDFNLFTIMDLGNSRFIIPKEKLEIFNELIEEFFSYKLPTIKSADELAKELAKKAKLLKDIVYGQLIKDDKDNKDSGIFSPIYDFYLGIQSLIKDIDLEDSADAYAQTVTYSLFLAKRNSNEDIDKASAYTHIPENVGIIKQIFTNMSGSKFPSNISWIIEDIIDVLNVTDMKEVFVTINKRGKKDKDPIIFLYEDFLEYYDPIKKKKMGVYYTERPIVNFMVKSTHYLLKEHFDKPDGFADDNVTVLDPAAGTGTFFWIIYLKVITDLIDKGLRGLKNEKIHKHLLKHFYGLELLITPYVIGHLKLYDLLQSWGYKFKESDRIQIYLTNTLEPADTEPTLLPFMGEIRTENIVTSKIKSEMPILVIIGNPPYSGESANKGEWIKDLLKKGYDRPDGSHDDGYYVVDGNSIDEKNLKWLQDDYVKFIRFGQQKIDKNGEGIVAFITNHSYLDNPTFRGMRESLLESFNRIYVLNLHGNTKKREKCPDGSKDENVFKIQQGVAISIFIKNSKFNDKKVFYADLWGLKKDKYNWLDRHSVANVDWEEIDPISEFYFFIPMDNSIVTDFGKFWRIKDIFPMNNVGIVTARDNLTIQWTEEDVWEVINDFMNLSQEDARTKYNLRKDVRDWKVQWAQEDLKSADLDKKNIIPIHYRPFDVRYTYYTGKSRGFHCYPRIDIMKHMQKDNLGLILGRQWGAVGSSSYDIVFAADKTIDLNLYRRGGALIFPLYLYQDSGKTPNINPKFIEYIDEKYGVKPSPEKIFYYIYAILQSPNYREKYEPILRYDLPRIPIVDELEKFMELADIGKYLADLHLMKRTLSVKTKFDIEGSNFVGKVNYKDGKVWINKDQYFDGVTIDAWEFHIGGYDVLDHYLKERKNKKLSMEEIENFLQVVEIIKKSVVIMKQIDRILGIRL